jgi:hypothetical protein
MEILIPISLFAMIAAIVIVPTWLKSQERLKMQETLRAAYQNGQPVSPEILEAMTRNVKVASVAPSPYRDVRRAVILLCVAGALVTIGLIHGWYEGYDDVVGWFASAAFPGFIGLGYLGLYLFGRDKTA